MKKKVIDYMVTQLSEHNKFSVKWASQLNLQIIKANIYRYDKRQIICDEYAELYDYQKFYTESIKPCSRLFQQDPNNV